MARGFAARRGNALLANATTTETRGAAFGLRQSLDTTGALLGPLVAIGLMSALAGDVRAVFWIATLPAIAAVLALVIGVEEPPRPVDARSRAALPRWSDVSALGRPFWLVVMTGAIFTLARFSEAFLIVRAMDAGLSLNWTPLALAVMNVTYVLSAYPVGKLSDRVGRRGLLLIGLAILIGADVVLIVATQLQRRSVRDRAVGASSGTYAGAVVGVGGRHGADRLAGFGIRRVLFRHGHGGSGIQRAGWLLVETMGAALHVWGGGDFRSSCNCRILVAAHSQFEG